MDRLDIRAAEERDYPAVQGSILVLAVTFVVVNTAVDIIYAFVDPRIKSQYKSIKRRKRHGED